MYYLRWKVNIKGVVKRQLRPHKEISRRCRELGVDTIGPVCDTHWLLILVININNCAHILKVYTPVMNYPLLSKYAYSYER